MTVQQLQNMLSTQNKNDVVEFGLLFKDKSRISIIEELEQYCGKLYDMLIDAMKCVDLVKSKEERMNGNAIYYDRRHGHNEGAKALDADIEDLMRKHYEKMLYFSMLGQ